MSCLAVLPRIYSDSRLVCHSAQRLGLEFSKLRDVNLEGLRPPPFAQTFWIALPESQ